MSASYLIRIDDICPTMNWAVWREVETLLIRSDIRPMLGVIPDNQDESLKTGSPENGFWERARAWQDRGWTIGVHGYQHKYTTKHAGLMGINKYSEFAGLPRDAQAAKLRLALEIFCRERIRPEVWIAPAHSFDHITVDLLREMGLRRISDGFFLFPNLDFAGMLWIPQQMWRFRPMPFGVWTVCLHINHWGPRDIARFRHDVGHYGKKIISVQDAIARFGQRRRDWRDGVIEVSFPSLLRARRKLRAWIAQGGATSHTPSSQCS